MVKEPLVFALSSLETFSSKLVQAIGCALGALKLGRFPDGEGYVEILENVRGRSAIVVQSIAKEPERYLIELLLAGDALKRAGAKHRVALIPYFGYARQDRRANQQQTAISAKVVANLLQSVGFEEVITIDLHSLQIEGFFEIPVQDLCAKKILAKEVTAYFKPELIVSPDVGSIKIAKTYARHFGVDFATVDKQRLGPDKIAVHSLIGQVEGKRVLLVDDLCSTGATLVAAALACQEAGATGIMAALTHGLFALRALEAIEGSPIERLFVTDTVQLAEYAKRSNKIHEVSVAGLFADAIRRM